MGGCSSEVLENWTPTIAASTTPAPADLTQPNYRRVVGDNIRTVLPKIDTLGDLEISSAQLVDHLNGPAWLTCLKLDAHGKPQHHALFIQGDKIIDSRAGVLIDQCHKKTFERFDLPPPPTPKQQSSNSPSAPAR
jgi:hypothetical protein